MGSRTYTSTSDTTTLEFQFLQNTQPFDAYSVRQVVIYGSYNDAVNNSSPIQTIASGSILHVSTGLYQYTSAVIATAGTYYDKIYLTSMNGDSEKTYINSFVVSSFSQNVTVVNVRYFLEGYGITTTQLSDSWINSRINNFIMPYVEQITRQSFSGIKTTTEYHDGAGEPLLILDKKPIVAVTDIHYVTGGDYQVILDLAMIETIAKEGILKAKIDLMESTACFPYFVKGQRNISVTYQYGYVSIPDDVKEAILYLTAYQCLNFVGARTGGGDIGVQGANKHYSDIGKYGDILKHLSMDAHMLLAPYITNLVGS